MITLRARNTNMPILMADEASQSFDILHPAFSDEFLGGSYSFPIEIIASPETNLALGNPGDFHNAQNEYQVPVDILYRNHVWKTGTLIIDRPGKKKHGGYIRAGIQSWDVLDKKLSEINYGGAIPLGASSADVVTYANDTVLTYWNWYERGFYFPMIYNPDFYGSANADFSGLINRWDRTGQTFKENSFSGGITHNEDTLVPCPYLLFICRKIFEQAGYRLPDTAVEPTSGSGLEKMVFYSNTPLDKMGDPHYHCFVGIDHVTKTGGTYRVPYIDESAPYYDPDAVWNTSALEYTVQVPGLHKIKYSIDFVYHSAGLSTEPWRSVFLNCKLDLVGLNNGTHGMEIVSNLQDGHKYHLEMELSPVLDVTDVGRKIIPQFIFQATHVGQNIEIKGGTLEIVALDNSSVNIYSSFVDIKNHVPDLTVREFLTELQNLKAIAFIPDERTKEILIKKQKSAITPVSSPENWTSKIHPDWSTVENEESIRKISYLWPSDDALIENNFAGFDPALNRGKILRKSDLPACTMVGESYLVQEENVRYVTKTDNTGALTWEYLRDEYDEFIFDPDGKKDIELAITPLFMTIQDDTDGNDLLMPKISQLAQSTPFSVDGGRTAPRFLYVDHYLGGIASPLFYPFATTQATRDGNPTGNCGSSFKLNYDTFPVTGEPDEMLIDYWPMLLFRKGKVIYEMEIDLNFTEIQNLESPDFGIFYRKNIDYMQWIVKQATITLGKNTELTKIQLFRREV